MMFKRGQGSGQASRGHTDSPYSDYSQVVLIPCEILYVRLYGGVLGDVPVVPIRDAPRRLIPNEQRAKQSRAWHL